MFANTRHNLRYKVTEKAYMLQMLTKLLESKKAQSSVKNEKGQR